MSKRKELEKYCREVANQKYVEIRKFSNCSIICINTKAKNNVDLEHVFNSWDKIFEYLESLD